MVLEVVMTKQDKDSDALWAALDGTRRLREALEKANRSRDFYSEKLTDVQNALRDMTLRAQGMAKHMPPLDGVPEAQWRWFGQPGHFIGAEQCRFHLHTHVGSYCVSTVGNYFPKATPGNEGKREEVGDGRFFETVVFRLGENDAPVDHRELYMRGCNDRGQAQAEHSAACALASIGHFAIEEQDL